MKVKGTARKSRAKSAPRGDILRFEGHDYVIVGPDPRDPGVTVFERDDDNDPTTPNKQVSCCTADITDSGEGWYYLPHRIAPPLAGDYDARPGPNGKPRELVPSLPEHVKLSIRSHPAWILGRDDLAAREVCAALKVTFPVHVSEPGFAERFATVLHQPKTPAGTEG